MANLPPRSHFEPPAPDPYSCVQCGGPAWDRDDPEDSPYSATADDGYLCSLGCDLAHRLRSDDPSTRVRALREAVEEAMAQDRPDLVPDAVTLTVAGEHDEAQLTGGLADWRTDRAGTGGALHLYVENEDGWWIAFDRIVDVALPDA